MDDGEKLAGVAQTSTTVNHFRIGNHWDEAGTKANSVGYISQAEDVLCGVRHGRRRRELTNALGEGHSGYDSQNERHRERGDHGEAHHDDEGGDFEASATYSGRRRTAMFCNGSAENHEHRGGRKKRKNGSRTSSTGWRSSAIDEFRRRSGETMSPRRLL
jgi:hypothetical protein